VASVPPERTGVLVLRAWLEDEPPRLRIRITRVPDVSVRAQDSLAAASIEEACTVVRRWLEAFVRDGFVTGP
jgi:hypothetical protein